MDIFRCFVSHQYHDDTIGMPEWSELEQTGKLADKLIEKLLEKVPDLSTPELKKYVLQIMEKFDIIVRPMNDDAKNDFYMPCMIKVEPFHNIIERSESKNYRRTSWFCLKFNFFTTIIFQSYFSATTVKTCLCTSAMIAIRFLCDDCSRRHCYDIKYQRHSMQPISDSFILNCKLPLGDGIYGIQDIICLPDGEVVAAVYNNKDIPELLVFSISGKRRHVIQLDKIPRKVDVVDKNTVAVLFDGNIVAIIDIQQNHVQYIRHILMFYGSGTSLIYIENELYLGYGFLIVVIDMSGNVKRRITLSFTPCDMCYNLDSQPLRIYCIDGDSSNLICINRDGTIKFTFTNPSKTNLSDLTIDNDGNVLALCIKGNDNPGYVIKVDSNGDNSEVVITNIKTSRLDYSLICYDHLTDSVVIGVANEVYMYQKK
ncbi:unnamed protein product [Mytilus edulis]|uniref:Uncharacterized protein n=1 Tax=Mytilus edulis TaxID=6550 RepID=A0A8S3UCD9_MYTED|nr:unnamed protein product [Mytilus edulis]